MLFRKSREHRIDSLKIKTASRWRVTSRIVVLIALISGILATFPKTATVSDTSALSWTHYDIPGTHNFKSVSCTSSAFCMAVDNQGDYAIWNGNIWTSHSISPVNIADPDNDSDTDTSGPLHVGDINAITSVSCISTVFCVAVGRKGEAFTWNGTDFRVAILGQIKILSSDGITTQLTINNGDIKPSTTTTEPSTTSTTNTEPSTTSTTTTEPSTTSTSSGSSNGNGSGNGQGQVSDTVQTDGGTSTTKVAVNSTTTIADSPTSTSVTSSSTSSTSKGDRSLNKTNRSVSFDSLTSSDSNNSQNEDKNFQPAGDLRTVSCSSATYCVTVDNQGASYVFNGSAWKFLSQINGSGGDGGGRISSLSCTGNDFCMAVDSGGRYYALKSGIWTGPTSVDAQHEGDGGLVSVSCTSSNFCMAVDSNAYFLTWNVTAGWSAPQSMNQQDIGSPTSVSCPTTGFCVAVDNQGYALSWTGGTTWSTAQVPGDNSPNLTSVSCASDSYCAAVDTNGDAFNGMAVSVITSITPTSGPPSGGTKVSITGSGFTGANSVHFGTNVATTFKVVSDTSITATSPAGTGTVSVTVTTPAGTSATNANTNFSYSLTVTAISPTSGPSGATVTITGTGFSSGSTVDFGTAAAKVLNINTAGTTISATAPAGTGSVQVYVMSNGVQASEPTPINYTYLPTITSLSPSSGPAAGDCDRNGA